jgi:hypothetical protein
LPRCTVDAGACPAFEILVVQLAERFPKVRSDLDDLYTRISQDYLIGDRVPRLKKGAAYAGKIWKYGCPNSDRKSGRSWGYRVIGFYDSALGTLYPIFVYDHPDKSDITPQDVDGAMTALNGVLAASRSHPTAPSPPSSQ